MKWHLIFIASLLSSTAMAQSVPTPFSVLGAVPTIPQWMSAWQSKQDVFGLGTANQVLTTNGTATGLVWANGGGGGGLTLAGSSGSIQTNNGSGNLGALTPGTGVATAMGNTLNAAGGLVGYSALGSGAFASAYSLPTATNSVLGGVKPDGTTVTNTAGAISVTYGTAANTAAQGNDGRITGALQTSSLGTGVATALGNTAGAAGGSAAAGMTGTEGARRQ